MTETDKCPITGKLVQNFQKANFLSYEVEVDQVAYKLTFCRNCFKNIDFNRYRHLLGLLLLSGKLEGEIIHCNTNKSYAKDEYNFAKFLEEGNYPKTHKEKLNNLFLKLFSTKDYEGETVVVKLGSYNLLWYKYYFKNKEEFLFYYNTLINEKYIRQIDRIDLVDRSSPNYSSEIPELVTEIQSAITFEGLNYSIKIQEEGHHSKNCFIAMSFASTTQAQQTREAIKAAIIETGFNPIIVDEENIDSDQTINDKIIASLKKCKFCIADFTGQSKGVYFESGFALGQQKKVIYTCEEEDFKQAHFDIKPLQHIIYKTPAELKEKLIYKIEAWIK